ncbi:MAG: hypothetical protein QNK37_35315, partial [Acidobacteriota bacterium]|nr:hypothetical protein [Acidobacteriota bacterium]
PGRLSKFSREVPGVRAALQKPAENLLSPRPPIKILSQSTRCPGRPSKTGGKFAVAPAAWWFNIRHFSITLPELIEKLPKYFVIPGNKKVSKT